MQVRLELAAVEDYAVLRGLAAMRQQRLAPLARQAQVQGGLLTVEDLAYLTCSSLATVKRDLAACRRRDVAVPTQGQIKDIVEHHHGSVTVHDSTGPRHGARFVVTLPSD